MSDRIHIAVVDDERDIRETVAEYLEINGYRVSKADGGTALRRLVDQSELDLVILDITNPEAPREYMRYNAGGILNDAEDVIVGSTNATLFAYVADGRNGMKVLQLTSPSSQPNFYGFSPDPRPELIAWAKTPSAALAVAKGLDRDRGVDESGGQMAIFGRLGSRPFTRSEMEKLFLNKAGRPYKVSDTVTMADWLGPRPAMLTARGQ